MPELSIKTITMHEVSDMLAKAGPCSIDELINHFPHRSRTEVFIAVDQLVRDGRVMMHQFDYATLKYKVAPTTKLEMPHAVNPNTGGASQTLPS
jgi:hypothetical protein